MTMQTAKPLTELHMGTLNTSLAQIQGWAKRDVGLDMEQPYQRGDVWGLIRRRNLIRSFLMGVPIPSLILNDRFSAKFREPGYAEQWLPADRKGHGGRAWAYAVVDGKQRVTTVLMYYRDEFAVPASWWMLNEVQTTVETDDGPYVTFSGLSPKGQGRFDFAPIAVAMGRFPTLAGERFVFDLVNYGGVPQGAKDED